MEERLQKLLSQWGVASRRQAESLIEAGRVQVNGETAHLGQKADPIHDLVALDGRVISPAICPEHHYVLVNKPLGVVSTCDDPWGRATVLGLLPASLQQGAGMHPVGRLDANSTGALLLTNDGELTHRLTHPRHQVSKTYRVKVVGQPTAATQRQWSQGVVLDGRRTLPAQVRLIEVSRDRRTSVLEIILWEGRKRQIRRVAEYLGHPVVELHRVAIGAIQLGDLPPGHGRALTKDELDGLTCDRQPLIPR